MWYLLLKLLHVLAAVVDVGANVTYSVWIANGSRDPKVLPFALRGVKLIDDAHCQPGIWIVARYRHRHGPRREDADHQTPWLLVALALYIAVVLVGLLGYTPTLKKQIQLLDSAGLASSAYQAAAIRGIVLGVALAVLVVAIIFFMVVKPALWA